MDDEKKNIRPYKQFEFFGNIKNNILFSIRMKRIISVCFEIIEFLYVKKMKGIFFI